VQIYLIAIKPSDVNKIMSTKDFFQYFHWRLLPYRAKGKAHCVCKSKFKSLPPLYGGLATDYMDTEVPSFGITSPSLLQG